MSRSLALTHSRWLIHNHTTRASSTMVPTGWAESDPLSPECCRQRGTGPSLCSPWISMWFQAAVQTRDTTGTLGVIWAMDIYTDRHSGSIGWNHYSLRWLPRLLPSGCSSPSSSLQITSLHSDPAVPLLFLSHSSTPYLHITVAHAAGGSHSGQGLWVFNVWDNAKLPKKINLWPTLDTEQ